MNQIQLEFSYECAEVSFIIEYGHKNEISSDHGINVFYAYFIFKLLQCNFITDQGKAKENSQGYPYLYLKGIKSTLMVNGCN